MDSREQMALKVLSGRYRVSEAAAMFGVSRPTVRLWCERYRAEGRSGLEDRSHATKSCPHKVSQEVEDLIVAERAQFSWGSKKILDRLEEAHPELQFPKRSTIDAILARRGLVKKQKPRKTRFASPFIQRYDAKEPGELTTMDHKGEFRLLNGTYCYPLTLVDSVSRYILACVGLDSTSFERAWPVIERVFREHGLPLASQSDNGPPFGAPGGRFSRMSVRLMMLDVQPVFGRPAHPQDNGKHERMHREIKRETTIPPGATFAQQQKKFDAYLRIYNEERPHEGIGMKRPARVYVASPRPYPKKKLIADYSAHWEKRKITPDGYFKWKNERIFLSHVMAGQTIAMEPKDDQLWNVHFYRFVIGKLDESENRFL